MKDDRPRISIIIPVLNEALLIGRLLEYLRKNSSPDSRAEILVVDGGSDDDTVIRAKKKGAQVVHSARGRAVQMNRGAGAASGKILYFLHADTYPPPGFDQYIGDSVEKGDEAGCFRMRFDSVSGFLSFFSWFSRFNYPICRGGDQSLFITKSLFVECGGFNENYRVYEDNEFTSRLYKLGRFCVLPEYVITSARRYRQKNAIALQYHFGVMHLKYYLGAGSGSLYRYYSRNIGQ
jgi:rSAM/selenodomain-associated transferase 2